MRHDKQAGTHRKRSGYRDPRPARAIADELAELAELRPDLIYTRRHAA